MLCQSLCRFKRRAAEVDAVIARRIEMAIEENNALCAQLTKAKAIAAEAMADAAKLVIDLKDAQGIADECGKAESALMQHLLGQP